VADEEFQSLRFGLKDSRSIRPKGDFLWPEEDSRSSRPDEHSLLPLLVEGTCSGDESQSEKPINIEYPRSLVSSTSAVLKSPEPSDDEQVNPGE